MPAVFQSLAAYTVAPARFRPVVSNFSVTTACLRTIVLLKVARLGRVVIRVVADNVTNRTGRFRQTVRM